MTKRRAPTKLLLEGVKILDWVMNPFGFVFRFEAAGHGSGGDFAWGRYSRGDRSLELHFRHSLGLVRYQIARHSLDHESYMGFLGVHGCNQYHDFPKNPLDSFNALAHDLQAYCQDFLSGNGQQFQSYATELEINPNFFKGLSV
jgi:hypothetical protein